MNKELEPDSRYSVDNCRITKRERIKQKFKFIIEAGSMDEWLAVSTTFNLSNIPSNIF